MITSLPNLLLANEDNELQVQATICLKNFIRVATPTIIKKYALFYSAALQQRSLR